MYNLRARYYDPLNGRFNQMDPFAGNTHDPQSLHKYLYCHDNPINGNDPSGCDFSLTNLTVSMAIGAVIGAITGGVYAHYNKQSVWKGVLIGVGLGAVAGATVYLLWSLVGALKSGALQRFFWDPRAFSTISREYWQRFGPSAGRSLHHWLTPQRWTTWIPEGIQNAGFNLLKLPKILSGPLGLNQWMGFALRWGSSRMVVAMLVESGIRILVPVTGYASYHMGKWLGNELRDETIELTGGVSATPLKLSSAEEEEMQEDTGKALLTELK
jgi:hypothetical protein